MTKTGWRNMGLFIAFLLIALLGLMAFVRLAPDDAAGWHRLPEGVAWGEWGQVQAGTGSANLRLGPDMGAPDDLLARLDAIALATPRTRHLAGTPATGRVTWQTRSALWGFPDYTTAEVRPDGLYVFARLRFGSSDLGVNAARLSNWLDQIAR